DRVEGERRLARTRQAGDDHQTVAWQVDIDVAQIVFARTAHADKIIHVRNLNVGRSLDLGSPNIGMRGRGSDSGSHVLTAADRKCRADDAMLRWTVPDSRRSGVRRRVSADSPRRTHNPA